MGRGRGTPSANPASLRGNPGWHQQALMVEGRHRQLSEVLGGKLYHGSTAELDVGDIIAAGNASNYRQSAKDAVSLTSDLSRARYWASDVARRGGGTPHVYEVDPCGPVAGWRVAPANYGHNIVLWEGRAPEAVVRRRVE